MQTSYNRKEDRLSIVKLVDKILTDDDGDTGILYRAYWDDRTQKYRIRTYRITIKIDDEPLANI